MSEETYTVGTWVDGEAKVTIAIEGNTRRGERSFLTITVEADGKATTVKVPLTQFVGRVINSIEFYRSLSRLVSIGERAVEAVGD